MVLDEHSVGATAWHISLISSLVVLITALLAYHTLMSDFLHSLILELYPVATPAPPALSSDIPNILLGLLQEQMWTPLPLALILFPFTNVRDISQLASWCANVRSTMFFPGQCHFLLAWADGEAVNTLAQASVLRLYIFTTAIAGSHVASRLARHSPTVIRARVHTANKRCFTSRNWLVALSISFYI